MKPGLSKREYFAAMAMQGILANPSANVQGEEQIPQVVAVMARQCADALIAALEAK
jgi:hypothetical protein